jgi:hypothetical protein
LFGIGGTHAQQVRHRCIHQFHHWRGAERDVDILPRQWKQQQLHRFYEKSDEPRVCGMHNDFRFQKQDGVPGNQKQQIQNNKSKQQVKTTNSKQQNQYNNSKQQIQNNNSKQQG